MEIKYIMWPFKKKKRPSNIPWYEWDEDYKKFLEDNPGEWTNEKCSKMFRFMFNPKPGVHRLISWGDTHPCCKDRSSEIEFKNTKG